MPNRIWVKRTEVDAKGKKIERLLCCRSKSNTCGKAHLSYLGDKDAEYARGLAEATQQINGIFDKLMEANDDPGRELSLLMAPEGVHFLAWTVVDEAGEDCVCGDLETLAEVQGVLSLNE